MWNDLWTRDGTLSSLGETGSTYEPQLISDRLVGFRGGINRGYIRFRPRVVGVVNVWMDSDPGMRSHSPGVTHALRTSPGQSTSRHKDHFLFGAKLEPEILDCQIIKYCRLLYPQEVSDVQQQAAS